MLRCFLIRCLAHSIIPMSTLQKMQFTVSKFLFLMIFIFKDKDSSQKSQTKNRQRGTSSAPMQYYSAQPRKLLLPSTYLFPKKLQWMLPRLEVHRHLLSLPVNECCSYAVDQRTSPISGVHIHPSTHACINTASWTTAQDPCAAEGQY